MNLDLLTGFSEIFGGLYTTYKGNQLSILGSNMQADAFRSAGANTIVAANYNNAVAKANYQKQLGSFSNQIDRFMGQQRVDMAASGFASSSKTNLEITNETLTSLERQLLDMKNSYQQSVDVRNFEAQTAQAAYETKARTAEFNSSSSSTAAFNAGVSTLSKLPSLLGRI